ncbi:hypothetical protein FF36_01343 [Frankia torreyi]|uniref:Uncharacterized protein n=1 Tax=Frankia torreyi TaxID=1856 RepID=A0A0D8BJ56_9ACTN|nr:hypothetical protein FF36_01343 [Frankia torreyi]KQM06856.1 hypothetical protein FF86_1006109 [Frankia sp. CpI1-P]
MCAQYARHMQAPSRWETGQRHRVGATGMLTGPPRTGARSGGAGWEPAVGSREWERAQASSRDSRNSTVRAATLRRPDPVSTS